MIHCHLYQGYQGANKFCKLFLISNISHLVDIICMFEINVGRCLFIWWLRLLITVKAIFTLLSTTLLNNLIWILSIRVFIMSSLVQRCPAARWTDNITSVAGRTRMGLAQDRVKWHKNLEVWVHSIAVESGCKWWCWSWSKTKFRWTLSDLH